MVWEVTMIVIWYLLITIGFYVYGTEEINQTWDFPMLVCCLFWPLTVPSAVLIAFSLYLGDAIDKWWRDR